MIAILSKSQDQIEWEDIQSLVNEQVTESQHIEFKGLYFTSEKNIQDLRNRIQNGEIPDSMKHKICRTIAAFANSYGGAFILGVEDKFDSEKRHKKLGIIGNIDCIPICASFIDNLNNTINDRIEPRLPKLELIPVYNSELRNKEEGVLVIRTGRSIQAPHCVKFKSSNSKSFPTKSCPTRRGNNTEELTMHEIQDLTLNLSRGTERIKKKLKKRSREFSKKFKELGNPSCAWGVRMTAIPIAEDIRFGEVYSNGTLLKKYLPETHNVKYQEYDTPAFAPWEFEKLDLWRPKLRAAIRSKQSNLNTENNLPHIKCYQEIQWDGLIENVFLESCKEDKTQPANIPQLYCLWVWLIRLFANHLIWVDKARRSADSTNSEYAVDVEIKIIGSNLPIHKNKQEMMQPRWIGSLERKLTPQKLKFYTYPYNSRIQIKDLVCQFIKDLVNASGSDITINSSEIEISDFEEI